MSNADFDMFDENGLDNFRPETTDIILENNEGNRPLSNVSNTSLSSYINNIEGMQTQKSVVRWKFKFWLI